MLQEHLGFYGDSCTWHLLNVSFSQILFILKNEDQEVY